MNIAEVITVDCANGLRTRLSVFVSGCRLKCKGCFNEKAQDFEYGTEYNKDLGTMIYQELRKPYYDGITVLGGEPFDKMNQPGLYDLLKMAKVTRKNVWIYTGYKFEELMNGGSQYIMYLTDELLKMTDVIVDGPFIESEHKLGLKFKGSANQRIIDVPATLDSWDTKKEVVLLDL